MLIIYKFKIKLDIKKYIKLVFLGVTVTVAGFSIYNSLSNKSTLSVLVKNNVEALADGEGADRFLDVKRTEVTETDDKGHQHTVIVLDCQLPDPLGLLCE